MCRQFSGAEQLQPTLENDMDVKTTPSPVSYNLF